MHPLAAMALLTVRLYDAYPLSPEDLRAATAVATTTFAQAGITIQWRQCTALESAAPPGCDQAPRRGELILRVQRVPTPGGADVALGNAVVDRDARRGTLATVYANRVYAVARAARIDGGRVLGHAMAHEIGHLLLGSTGHAPHGLMRRRWTAAELQRSSARDWLFSGAEAATMRRRIGEPHPSVARLAN